MLESTFIMILTFLNDLPAHRSIGLAWFERVCSVVKEVCASFIVEGVTLVTFDGFGLIRSLGIH